MSAFYGQMNFGEKLGNSDYTIAEAGCLLTAICNGLIVFDGSSPNPAALDVWFSARGLFLYDTTDHASDDLAWNSITKYDPTITVQATGTSSVPLTPNAIVKFHYNSVQTGLPIDHYCWVASIDGSAVTIIDSWDGVVKPPAAYESVYHLPIGWATYVKAAPNPPPMTTPSLVTTPLSPPAAPIPIPVAPKHTLTYPVPGFADATDAGNSVNSETTVEPGLYYIYNTYPGKSNLLNLSLINGKPGNWVNTDDDHAPAVALPPFEPPQPTVTTPTATTPQDGVSTWKATYNSFSVPRAYVALQEFDVEEYSGRATPVTIPKYYEGNASEQGFPIHGTFVINNNMYGRIKMANDPTFALWYGVPLMEDGKDPHLVELYSELYDTTTDTASRIVTKTTTFKDHLIIGIENVEKVMDTVLRKKK